MSPADLRWSRAVIGSQKAVHYCEATDRGIVDGKKEREKKKRLCRARCLYQDVTRPGLIKSADNTTGFSFLICCSCDVIRFVITVPEVFLMLVQKDITSLYQSASESTGSSISHPLRSPVFLLILRLDSPVTRAPF